MSKYRTSFFDVWLKERIARNAFIFNENEIFSVLRNICYFSWVMFSQKPKYAHMYPYWCAKMCSHFRILINDECTKKAHSVHGSRTPKINTYTYIYGQYVKKNVVQFPLFAVYIGRVFCLANFTFHVIALRQSGNSKRKWNTCRDFSSFWKENQFKILSYFW